MPNWCYTQYVIEAEPQQLQTFNATLDKLAARKKPLIENGFGNLWCGIIVHLLGKDWHDIRCRGHITDYELQDNTLRINIESAWCELSEVRNLLLTTFPESDVYYITEEPGMEIYETNDTTGKYFSSRYVVDSEQDGMEYFDNLPETAAYLKNLIGHQPEPTEESIRKAIADWIEEDPETRWLCFNRFEEVEY